MTTTESNLTSDAIDLLMEDHREAETLFTRILNGMGAERRDAVAEVITELSRHAAVEEQLLYPAARKALPDGDQLADRAIDEHQEAKEILADLEKLDASGPEAGELLQRLMASVREHVQEEEQDLFPKLRASMTPDQLQQMGDAITKAKKMAPTHPHPNAPATPPGNVIAGAAAAIADKVRDSMGGGSKG